MRASICLVASCGQPKHDAHCEQCESCPLQVCRCHPWRTPGPTSMACWRGCSGSAGWGASPPGAPCRPSCATLPAARQVQLQLQVPVVWTRIWTVGRSGNSVHASTVHSNKHNCKVVSGCALEPERLKDIPQTASVAPWCRLHRAGSAARGAAGREGQHRGAGAHGRRRRRRPALGAPPRAAGRRHGAAPRLRLPRGHHLPGAGHHRGEPYNPVGCCPLFQSSAPEGIRILRWARQMGVHAYCLGS